jgi:succinate-semialdehyde dehydrogenase/glutarate-semialdehyde dehydrogenase
LAVVEPIAGETGPRRRLHLRSPATLEPLGEIEVAAAADVAAALERARKAQPDWAALSFAERGRYLRRAVRVLLGRQDEFLTAIERETGKPRTEALAVEILASCDALEFYAKNARRFLSDRTVPLHLLKTKRLRISYRPLGVVGIITPWNFPFLLSLNPTVQALAAGNAVLLKPSEATPASGRLVEELFRAAGLPEGVVQVLLGDGETGAALVEAGVDKICFTGSVATGRRVAESCARRLLPCTLELGGKDPMIVCVDADLERAARGAVYGAFANAGQVCVSTERVYVVEEVAEPFVARVVEEAARLRQGPEGDFELGPLICSPQLEVVERQVRDAVAKGARVLTGGRRNPDFAGLFYEPTVLVDVDHGMEIMQRETFGPVLPIMRVHDEIEALRLANDTRYGLSASIWTRDRRRGVELARGLVCGSVVINDCLTTYGLPEAPFGGRRESGIGQVNGEVGLRSYCHAQSIVVDRLGARAEPLWYPYGTHKTRRLARLMRVLWGTPLGRWLS